MSDELVYVPGGDDDFIQLSKTPTGRLFKKHILSKGPLYYPGVRGGKVDIDDKFLETVVKNFEDHVVGHVQAPVVDGNNAHTEDPFRNIGEVVDLKIEDGKLYSYIDVRDEEASKKMGKTLLGASAMLSLDWKNTKTNKNVGPAIIHAAITNNPHLNDLEDFEEIISMSSVRDSNTSGGAIVLSNTPIKETKMDLDEMIASLRDEHGIDVPALQRAAAEAGTYAKLSADLQDALSTSGVLKLSNTEGEESSAEDIVAAVSQLAQDRVELSNKVDALVEDTAKTKAEKRVDDLVATGFIAPAKRDANLKLLLSNPEAFDELLPEKPIVELSNESGKEYKEDTHDVDVDAEIARLSSLGHSNGMTITA